MEMAVSNERSQTTANQRERDPDVLWDANALLVEEIVELLGENNRLRAFIQGVVGAPDAMVCRLTRDAAREALYNR